MLQRISHALGKNVGMAKSSPKNPLVVVLGATGTGKSQLAVDLATRYNGEIINADAMQMYDGLPIATNKVTDEEQQGIPHHLLGFIPLDEEPWRVGMFRKKASHIIREIRSRGRLPIVVGGTHYYTQSLLSDDFFIDDKVDEEGDTQELSNQDITDRFPILEAPTDAILDLLKEVDPIMADRWHPSDRRKIRRSLAIYLMSGKRASDIYAGKKENKSAKPCHGVAKEAPPQSISDTLLFWVHSEYEILKNRLDSRVDKMLRAGLIQEVDDLNKFLIKQAAAGITVDRSRGVCASIGWKEFESYLNALDAKSVLPEQLNELFETAIERTKIATRQYAKRQIRWIRLKLMPALLEENALDQLYLLDGSDVALWTAKVSKPALEIAKDFLEGAELRPPTELSRAAKEILDPEKPEQALDAEPVRQECELCNVVCVQRGQWEAHSKSRRHQALVKKRQRNPNGMSSRPKNDRNSGSEMN